MSADEKGPRIITKVQLIAPLFYRRHSLRAKMPFEFGPGIRLEVIPSWLKAKKVMGELSSLTREQVKGLDYALVADCKSPSNEDEREARQLLISANVATWLAKPSPLGFGVRVMARQDASGWAPMEDGVGEVPCLEPHSSDLNNEIKAEDLKLARELFRAITGLPRAGAVWVAVRTLWTALRQPVCDWEVRYLLLWVALEALFGPEDGRELTYRISQRLAFFLAKDKDRKSARTTFKTAKEGYGWRCKIVHGRGLKKLRGDKAGKSAGLMYDAERLVRDSVKKILTEAELVARFGHSKQREPYLDGLPFSADFDLRPTQ